MIGVRLRVPIACWRKAHARELIETEILPPPATCYGALLSLVGETDRARHVGCRVTAGLLNEPNVSTILRTFWRIKNRSVLQGNGENARPDFQQLVLDADLVVWCDSTEEAPSVAQLESRIEAAMKRSASIERFGGWSLGESTHLINDATLLTVGEPSATCRTFLEDSQGSLTLPVWVDHVGTKGTRYAVGDLEAISGSPASHRIPRIEPPDAIVRQRKE